MTPKEKAEELVTIHLKYCCHNGDTKYMNDKIRNTPNGVEYKLAELFEISARQNAIHSAVITVNEVFKEISENRKLYLEDVLKELKAMLIKF